jgi:hypothetical protein
MENWVAAFIVIAAVAILIQMGLLMAMYISMKKTSDRVNAVAEAVEKRGVPLLESVSGMVTANAPKINVILDNAVETSKTARQQLERLDTTVTDIVDRTRLQVIRVDELVTRTMDRVEETTDLVHHTVISPVKALAGVVSGVTATANLLFGGGKRRRKPGPRNGGPEGPEEEMFI